MTSASPIIGYSDEPPARVPRGISRWPLVFLMIFALPIAAWFSATQYTAHKWRDIKVGMTRAQVDQELVAFRSYPSPYSDLGPGQYVLRYELMWMGKSTTIQIIYNADGTVDQSHPVFDN